MAYTSNCIVCAEYSKRRAASIWTGYVVLFDEINGTVKKKNVVAGFCDKHQSKSKMMPHQEEISRHKWCYGLWTGDMGINSARGPLVKEY